MVNLQKRQLQDNGQLAKWLTDKEEKMQAGKISAKFMQLKKWLLMYIY